MNSIDLVLLGGGHAHVLLIRQMAMQPVEGMRITLVSEQSLTPYSGMLPGFIAGHYSRKDTLIDLNRLCRVTGVRWVCGRVYAMDLEQQLLKIDGQPDVAYDLLSIDTGSSPDVSFPGATEHALGVKPISRLHQGWAEMVDRVNTQEQSCRIGVVGAGVAGTELALAVAWRFRDKPQCSVHLLFPQARVLPGMPAAVVKSAERALQKLGVQLHTGFRLAACEAGSLIGTQQQRVDIDQAMLCTPAVAPDWPRASGLDVDQRGFIQVNEFLQSTSHPNVFAAGDVANMQHDPRPKAGVFAVRQAPFLADNLRRKVLDQQLRPIRLQKQFLHLISLGGQDAIACRNGLSFSSPLMWRWKDRIDRQFMRQISELRPEMARPAQTAVAGSQEMHCGACGSKLGPQLIQANLQLLQAQRPPASAGLSPALAQAEDAVLWSPQAGKQLAQSIDGFRSFTSDHYILGRVAALHAVNDIHAMGADAVHAQVCVNLAFAHPRLQQRDHLRLMHGIQDGLEDCGAVLSGGHSTEGVEDHISLVVNGELDSERLWRKAAVQVGDVLLLNKALGTGVILAADAQGMAEADTVDAALASMLKSNRALYEALKTEQVHALTDVSGFGLLGHLLEMLGGSELGAELWADCIQALPGALDLLQQGVRSSLQPALQGYLNELSADGSNYEHLQQLLLDPQTSGGLLMALPASSAERLLKQGLDLQAIGRVCESSDAACRISLLNKSEQRH